MKSYTIGREETCDIVIPDPSQMVSRNHATLTLNGSKMTITDNSSNGTYINGIRISSGTPVPVTREDVVSFAQVVELDWKKIPNPGKRTLWIVLAIIAVLAVAGCGCWYFLGQQQAKKDKEAADALAASQVLAAQVDTLQAQVERAGKALEGLKTSLDAVKEECARKPAAKIAPVKTLLEQVEKKVTELDAESLTKSLGAVRQSLEDGSEKTEQRASELSAQISAFTAALDAVRTDLDAARNQLSAIPDASGAAKAKPAKTEQEPAAGPEQKQDSRVF